MLFVFFVRKLSCAVTSLPCEFLSAEFCGCFFLKVDTAVSTKSNWNIKKKQNSTPPTPLLKNQSQDNSEVGSISHSEILCVLVLKLLIINIYLGYS